MTRLVTTCQHASSCTTGVPPEIQFQRNRGGSTAKSNEGPKDEDQKISGKMRLMAIERAAEPVKICPGTFCQNPKDLKRRIYLASFGSLYAFLAILFDSLFHQQLFIAALSPSFFALCSVFGFLPQGVHRVVQNSLQLLPLQIHTGRTFMQPLMRGEWFHRLDDMEIMSWLFETIQNAGSRK